MKRFFTLMLIALSLTIFNESCKPEPEEELGSIYGIITDKATGEPVKNANVQLRPSGETSLTGNDGRYEFLDLKSGDYSITVSKTGYTDLIDDYVITVDGSKAMRRDVQIEKLPAALKVLDDNGNDIDSLDFGSNIDDVSRLFNIFNNGVSVLKYEVLKTASWITSLSSTEGSLQPGATKPVVVGIDRAKLSVGENTTTIHVTSDNGSKQLVVKAFKLGDVVTLDPINVTLSSAMLRGNVNKDISYSQKGFSFWSDSDDATNLVVEGNSVGEFVYHVTNLEEQTTYYYRAYMICNNETIYGEQKSFKTAESIDKPTVVSKDVTNITQTTATCGGNVTSNGGANVTARGVCWSTSQNPTTSNNHTTDGTGEGEFTSNITNLAPNTQYYVRAYATNEKGTSYGEQKSFTTSQNIELPTVTTNNVSSITQTTATCGGNVTSNGGATVTARGVCWSTSQNPTTSNSHTTDGTGEGEFTSNLTGLTANKTYYVRAYATNEKGTSYGEQKSFTTSQNIELPTVTTNNVSSITQTTATCGGNVTSNGGATVTARGICWGEIQNPNIDNIYCEETTDGNGTGSFTSYLTNLKANTTYYVRAYATNEKGTSYGEQKSFTTLPEIELPTVTTYNVSSITQTTASCGGYVTSDGNATVTARGVCWSTTQNPTISNNHTTDGTGTGSFASNLTGLTANTTYYVRAYATNEKGTSYGEQKSFTTMAYMPTVVTYPVTDYAETTATFNGNVVSDGGASVTARGFCWSTSPNPTINQNHNVEGSGNGEFTSNIPNLAPNTQYYVRAYATNETGTSYGEEVSFKTLEIPSNNQLITVNGVSFTMIAVEGGTFQMGATSEQGSDAYDNEYPVHSVTLSDYYIGETEVTQELWEAVMGSNPSNFSGYPQRPVEKVSWYDCQEFITKLNELTGKNFRLPTEAEWEYAARGGNESLGYKYSGSNTIGNVAWYYDNSSSRTHDVKTKSPNELGIYDMSGNVWEWCQDWYGSYSSGSQTNPTGPSSGSYRVLRGGSWSDSARICRVSNRGNTDPDSRDPQPWPPPLPFSVLTHNPKIV